MGKHICPDAYKSKMCEYMTDPAGCRFGDLCWYAHNAGEIRGPDPAQQALAKQEHAHRIHNQTQKQALQTATAADPLMQAMLANQGGVIAAPPALTNAPTIAATIPQAGALGPMFHDCCFLHPCQRIEVSCE